VFLRGLPDVLFKFYGTIFAEVVNGWKMLNQLKISWKKLIQAISEEMLAPSSEKKSQ
jgi:hypothetical protein